MKTAYLIYYHDQDSYEGCDQPFAIVHSEERAKQIVAEIIAHGKKIASQMKYEFEDGISDEEYWSRDSKNRELTNQPWPYNWQVSYNFDFERSFRESEDKPIPMIFDENTVAYKELPVL